jgi:hypothetical protein
MIAHGPVSPIITPDPWACCNGLWDIPDVQPLSHGKVLMDHGTFKMSILYPMAHYLLPMVLCAPASKLSHGSIALNHGTFPRFNIYPMVLSFPASHLSHGTLCVAHGPAFSCTLCVPWACSNGPWDISNVQPLSQGTLLIAHGPVFCYIGSVPWACSNGPWDMSNVHPLSHGTLCVAHGPYFSWITCVPWACSNGPWDTPMGGCMLPMVLSCPTSPLSHGQVPMDHGT